MVMIYRQVVAVDSVDTRPGSEEGAIRDFGSDSNRSAGDIHIVACT